MACKYFSVLPPKNLGGMSLMNLGERLEPFLDIAIFAKLSMGQFTDETNHHRGFHESTAASRI